MKIVPILGIVTAGILLSTALVFANVVIPNTSGPNNISFWARKTKKKSRNRKGKQIFAFCHENLLASLAGDLIPEITTQSGGQIFVRSEYDFLPGRYKTGCCADTIAQGSAILIILDRDLVSAPWLLYVMALSYQHGNSIILCFDEAIDIQALPRVLQDLYLVSLARIPCRTCHQAGRLLNPRQIAQSIVSSLEWTDGPVPLPVWQIPKPPPLPGDPPWKYSAYILHDPEDLSFASCLKPANWNNFCISDVTIGKFLFQGYSEAIHSSETILVILTEKFMQNPLFEHQLKLALRCKRHKAIVFVLDRKLRTSCTVSLLENTALASALAVCKKIIV